MNRVYKQAFEKWHDNMCKQKCTFTSRTKIQNKKQAKKNLHIKICSS